MKHHIDLPAVKKRVSVGAYVRAVKMAKENPEAEFTHGLSTWGATKGDDIVYQFWQGLVDRINRHMEIREDRKGPERRKLAYHQKVGRECKWCGTRFYPVTTRDDFCDHECRAAYCG